MVSRMLERIHLFWLLSDDVSLRGDDVAPRPVANDFMDALRDARIGL